MRDAPIDVEPETFDAASKVVGHDMAGRLTEAVADLEHGLAMTAGMAGSDPGGTRWASAYDEAASATAGVVTDLANACAKIAEMLEQTGFNHGAAEDASNPARTVPTGPDTTTYFPRPAVTPPPPPPAGGGSGGPPDGWGLIQQAVGYVWPNGDPGRLRAAAEAWTSAAGAIDAANRSFPEAIEAIRGQQSPEVDDAATVCQTLSQHIEDTAAACRDLSTACTDYANHLDQAHQDIDNELADLLASTAVIEGAGIVGTEIGGEFWVQGIEASRISATAAKVAQILAPLTEAINAAADTVTTIVSRIAPIAQRLKVILGAQITRAAAAVVERLPGLAQDTETTAYGNLSAWSKDWSTRGLEIEKQLGGNLPRSFPTIDKFDNGVATSIKSVDLSAPTYQDTGPLASRLRSYVDSVADFKGKSFDGVTIRPNDITQRELQVAVQPGVMSSAQQAAFDQVEQYAQSKGVNLTISEVS